MLTTHLRHHAVAYLALAVALGTGTAYAADRVADGSVTTKKLARNAVTSPKVKRDAIRSADVRDGSITTADLAASVPLGDTLLATVMRDAVTPAQTPDSPDLDPLAFSAPRAGTVHLDFYAGQLGVSCSVGTARVGLYVDGEPVPGTGVVPPTTASTAPLRLVGSMAVGAGPHTVALGSDCASGTVASSTYLRRMYTVTLSAR
jgi:hypothetical protein